MGKNSLAKRGIWAAFAALVIVFALKVPDFFTPPTALAESTIVVPNIGFNIGFDDALQIQAARRFAAGEGYTAYAGPPTKDLSTPSYSYPAAWPPGPMILFKNGHTLGMNPYQTYEFFGIFLLAIGVAGWTVLAVQILAPCPKRVVFAFVLLFTLIYAKGWIKLADMTVFSMNPFYWFSWLMIAEGTPRQRLPAFILSSFLLSFMLFFWNGAVYLLPAGLVTWWWLTGPAAPPDMPKLKFKTMAAWGAIWMIVPLISFAYIQGLVHELSGGDFFGHTQQGLFLKGLSPSALWPTIDSATGSFLGVQPFTHHLLTYVMGDHAAKVLSAVVLSVALYFFVKRGWRRLSFGETHNPATDWVPFAAFVHFLALVGMLAYMSVRYQYSGVDASQLNMLIQVQRFAHHLVPLLAIAWLVPLYRGIESVKPTDPVGPRTRALLAYVALAWLWVGWDRVQDVWIAMHPEPNVAPIPGEERHPSEYVMADIYAHPERPNLVIDPNLVLYLSHPQVNITSPILKDRWDGMGNKREIYLYAVVYNTKIAPPWVGDPQVNYKNTLELSQKLGLKPLRLFPGGTGIYSGWVKPFAPGTLSETQN